MLISDMGQLHFCQLQLHFISPITITITSNYSQVSYNYNYKIANYNYFYLLAKVAT